jgi:hypothetical protein
LHIDFSERRHRVLRQRWRRQHEDVEALKDEMSEQELKDLAGPGTRSLAGFPLRWAAPDGVVHACEAAEVLPDEVLVWTLGGHHDVPPLPFEALADDDVPALTCVDCAQALAAAHDP